MLTVISSWCHQECGRINGGTRSGSANFVRPNPGPVSVAAGCVMTSVMKSFPPESPQFGRTIPALAGTEGAGGQLDTRSRGFAGTGAGTATARAIVISRPTSAASASRWLSPTGSTPGTR